ncbi:MAG: hypothetical protein Alpg2KO_28500 [Alphaproteobacteria bacterium]
MATKARKRPALILSARRSTWNTDPTEGRTELERVAPQVHKRDKGTCLFCGFQSVKYQELHHVNHDHTNHAPENLATICSMCHMTFHIGRAGLLGEAELVWLPEMPQQMLNHTARAIFIAMAGDGDEKMGAESLYSALRVRADDARRRIGTSDPADLGEAMLALDNDSYRRRAETLNGIRLLPLGRKIVDDKDIFPEMLKYWTSPKGPFAKVPPKRWGGMFDHIRRQNQKAEQAKSA